MLATLTGSVLHRSEPQVTHRCGGDKNSPGSRPAVRIKRGAIHPGTVLAQQEALLSRQFKHLAALTQPSPPAGEVRRDPRRLHSQRHRPRRAASLRPLRWAWLRFPECTAARFRGRRSEVQPQRVLATEPGPTAEAHIISYHSEHPTRATCACGHCAPGTDTQHTAFGSPMTHILTVKAHAPGQKEHT